MLFFKVLFCTTCRNLPCLPQIGSNVNMAARVFSKCHAFTRNFTIFQPKTSSYRYCKTFYRFQHSPVSHNERIIANFKWNSWKWNERRSSDSSWQWGKWGAVTVSGLMSSGVALCLGSNDEEHCKAIQLKSCLLIFVMFENFCI